VGLVGAVVCDDKRDCLRKAQKQKKRAFLGIFMDEISGNFFWKNIFFSGTKAKGSTKWRLKNKMEVNSSKYGEETRIWKDIQNKIVKKWEVLYRFDDGSAHETIQLTQEWVHDAS